MKNDGKHIFPPCGLALVGIACNNLRYMDLDVRIGCGCKSKRRTFLNINLRILGYVPQIGYGYGGMSCTLVCSIYCIIFWTMYRKLYLELYVKQEEVKKNRFLLFPLNIITIRGSECSKWIWVSDTSIRILEPK